MTSTPETETTATAPSAVKCARCGEAVACEPGHVVLSCWPIFSVYDGPNKVTKTIGHGHGTGRPGHLTWTTHKSEG